MGKKSDPSVLQKWKELSIRFPPEISSPTILYRLVTIPIGRTKDKHLTFRPAPGYASSWSQKLSGIRYVAGIARDFKENARTARVVIKSEISPDFILATPASIKKAFRSYSHDYFDRYPEVEVKEKKNGDVYSKTTWPGYPGGDDAEFDMDEMGYMREVLNRPGGFHLQHECVVETPESIDAEIVEIYRLGNKILKHGQEE